MRSLYLSPIKRISKPIVISLGGVLLLAAFFRLANLGYSEFQGDEVKVQGFLFYEGSLWEFLLTRTLAPGESLVAYAVSTLIEPSVNSEFSMRLPFALAGVLAPILLYLLARRFLDHPAACFVFFLAGFSGLFIAFSRLVQYQAFVLLFSILSVYAFSQFLVSSRSRFLIVSGLSGGLGLLFHYDALSVSVPVVATLIVTGRTKKITYFIVPFLAVTAIFYIPFVFSAAFVETLKYLVERRITTYFPFDSVYYSLNLLSIYHSREFLLFLLFGCSAWFVRVSRKHSRLFIAGLLVLLAIIVIRVFNVTPRRLFIYPSVTLALGVFLVRLRRLKGLGFRPINFVELWFLFSFLVYGLYIRKPLTHIYNFLPPLFLLVSWEYAKLWKRYTPVAILVIIITFISSLSFNYQVFGETKTEYPWEKEAYIFGGMFPKMAEGEKWDGIFGFPHKSGWVTIERQLRGLREETGIYRYSTNEKYKLVRYYLRDFSQSDIPPYYFIYIKNPHSLEGGAQSDYKPVIEGENYKIFIYE